MSLGELREFARGVECSIIIACFNEEDNIENCVRGVRKVLPKAEIVVVHGGTDRTADIVENIASDDPEIRIIRNKPDYGKGHAIKVGILAAKYNLQGEIDADLQFSPEELPSLLYPIASASCSFTHASRVLQKKWTYQAKNPVRDLGNRFLSMLVSVLTGQRVTDVTAGFLAWDQKHIKKVWFDDDRFSYITELIIRIISSKTNMQEVPVSYRHREGGESMHANNLQVIRAGMKMVSVIFSTWFQAFILKKVRASSFPAVSPQLKSGG